MSEQVRATRPVPVEWHEPAGGGPRSAVIVLPGADGLGASGGPYRAVARALAAEGYAACVVPYLGGAGAGVNPGLIRPAGNDSGLMLRYLDTTPLSQQLDRAIAALRHAETPDRASVPSLNQRRVSILEKLRPALAPNLNSNIRRDPRSACGVTAAVTAVVASSVSPDAMNPSTSPLVVPTLPWLAVAGLLVAALPAWLAPPPDDLGGAG